MPPPPRRLTANHSARHPEPGKVTGSRTTPRNSLLRHWALSQQDHAITGGWSGMAPEDLDKLDAGLRSLVESGSGKKGSWLKARIYDTTKELNGAEAKSPTVDQVLVRLPESVRKALG